MQNALTPDQLAALRKDRSGSTLPPGRTVLEGMAEAGERRVPVRIIAPAQHDTAQHDTRGSKPNIRAVYLDIPGGGFYMAESARNDDRHCQLADALGVVVVSVDYRVAPEHPWPAAPDDCETAALWLINNVEKLFHTNTIIIGGASAGANLTLTTLLRLRSRQLLSHIAGAVLQFGAYDLSGQSPGGKLYADEWFVHAYAGHVTDRTHPDISPLHADLTDLPPALLVVGEQDLLLEDSRAMAYRLSEAGVDAELHVYPGAAHGFGSFSPASAKAVAADTQVWIAARLGA